MSGNAIVIAEINRDGLSLRFKRPIVLDIWHAHPHDGPDSDQVHVACNHEFQMSVAGPIGSLQSDCEDEAVVIWEEYAMEDDDAMTESAIRLKETWLANTVCVQAANA